MYKINVLIAQILLGRLRKDTQAGSYNTKPLIYSDLSITKSNANQNLRCTEN